MAGESMTVLITGGSSGIGYELAKLFAQQGYRLVMVANNAERLRGAGDEIANLFGASVTCIQKDLALPTAPQEIFDELERTRSEIDVLVVNAGVGVYGLFAQSDFEAEFAMMQLNMVSLTHLTKLMLKRMLPRGKGKILHVASTAGFQPGPLMAVYYATKAFVLAFSEALANELEGTGVTVSVLCPGPTRTGFQRRAGAETSKLFDWQTMDARSVAAIGYRGLMRNKTVIVPGLTNKLLTLPIRVLPRKWVTHMVRIVQDARQ